MIYSKAMDKVAFNPVYVLLAGAPVPSPLYAGIQRVAKEMRWRLEVEPHCNGGILGAWRGHGALVPVGYSDDFAEMAENLMRNGVHVVDLTNGGAPSMPRVAPDDRETGFIAARHFSERGFRHLAFFSSHPGRSACLMEEGFRQGADRADVRRFPTRKSRRDFNASAFMRLLEAAVIAAPKPLGVLCHDDFDAMAMINTRRNCMINIPNDVAILGVGDIKDVCENECVPLSSVRMDNERHGEEAARCLARLIAGGRRSRCKTVLIKPVDITERRTTDALGTDDPLLRQAVEAMGRMIGRPFGVPDVARALDVSRGRLDRRFSSALGHSTGREILRLRLSRAKELLLSGGLSVAETAAATGFCNAAYFIAVFKKATGLTPHAWKRSCGT